jgi:hypothetical protein
VEGGFAVIYHSQPRFTKDLGPFHQSGARQRQGDLCSSCRIGVPLKGIRPEDFTDRNSFFRLGRDPKGFDVLPSIPGVDFDLAWERRVEKVVDASTGLTANFISAEDLIASKLASGRPQDLADGDAIQRAVESQRPGTKNSSEPTGPNRT